MKMIVAVIKPYKLDEVRTALTVAGVQGLMVSEIKAMRVRTGERDHEAV